jgi:hypothetical protein
MPHGKKSQNGVTRDRFVANLRVAFMPSFALLRFSFSSIYLVFLLFTKFFAGRRKIASQPQVEAI